MEAVFIRLLNVSLSASLLILAIALVRAIFKRAPRWLYTVLWALVGVRLTVPIDIESIFSLVPSRITVSENITDARHPTVDTGVPVINEMINPGMQTALAPEVGASVNPLQVIVAAAGLVWLFGAILMLLYMLISYLLLLYRHREAARDEDGVYVSDAAASPFILGIIRPRIYLPSDIDAADREEVLLHERAHIDRLDHLLKPLAFTVLCIYWFNPLIWLGYVLLSRDIELACDERVARNMTGEERAAYAKTLLRLGCRRTGIGACPLAFGEVGADERIRALAKYKKPGIAIIAISVVLIIAAAVCFLTYRKSDDHPISEGVYYAADVSYLNPFSSYIPRAEDLPITVITAEGAVLLRTEELSDLSYREVGRLHSIYVSAAMYEQLFPSQYAFRDGLESFKDTVFDVWSIEGPLSDNGSFTYLFNTEAGLFIAEGIEDTVWVMWRLAMAEPMPKELYTSTYTDGTVGGAAITIDTKRRTATLSLGEGSTYTARGSFIYENGYFVLTTADNFEFKLAFYDTGTHLIFREELSELKGHTLEIVDGQSFAKGYPIPKTASGTIFTDLDADGAMELVYATCSSGSLNWFIHKNGRITASGNLDFTDYDIITFTEEDGALYLIGEFCDTDLHKYYYRAEYGSGKLRLVAEGVRA